MQKRGRQPLLIAFLVCECDYPLRTHKKIEPVDIRQTLQYTQQCIRVFIPAWVPVCR